MGGEPIFLQSPFKRGGRKGEAPCKGPSAKRGRGKLVGEVEGEGWLNVWAAVDSTLRRAPGGRLMENELRGRGGEGTLEMKLRKRHVATHTLLVRVGRG